MLVGSLYPDIVKCHGQKGIKREKLWLGNFNVGYRQSFRRALYLPRTVSTVQVAPCSAAHATLCPREIRFRKLWIGLGKIGILIGYY